MLLCLLFAASIAIGQLLFKYAANGLATAQGTFLVKVLLNPQVWIAFSWYGMSSLLWLYILMRVPLSRAYPFILLGSAIVPLGARLFFGERISATYVVGGLVVLAGLYIIFAQPGAVVPTGRR
jgi:drug/metabolite transporter (DMT)-like permease